MAECLLYLTNRAYLGNKAHRTAQNTKCVAFKKIMENQGKLFFFILIADQYRTSTFIQPSHRPATLILENKENSYL
jgi:hypothetical protein